MTRRRWLWASLLLVLPALLSACGDAFDDHPQDTFVAKGEQASEIKRLILPVLGVAGVVFVLVIGGCLYVAFQFRARDDEDYDDIPKQVHGNFKAEIAWTIAPAVVLLFIAVPTVITVFSLNADAAEDAVQVEVIGHQWWWEYRYDTDGDGRFDDIVTANDLVMPVNRDVALTITSRDVIHSFWVPFLNGKRDAVPNRNHPWTFHATSTGEFLGQCTEYCGLSHAEMRIKAVVLTEADYAKWLRQMQGPAETYAEDDTSLEAEGYRLFNAQLCSSCHLIEGVNDDKFVEVTDQVDSGTIVDPQLQVSRHAPNLTKFMTRSTFAGAKFDLRKDTAECKAGGPFWADDPDLFEKCFERAELEAWLRNPPAEKAMAPTPIPGRTGTRGMPNLNLSEEQIDQLVAYLTTLS